MPRPIIAHIDLSALQYNYALVKHAVSPAQVLAVIKANAYGHGVVAVAQALQKDLPAFALIEIEYACKLREHHIDSPILLLEGVFEEAELALCQQHHFMIAVHNMHQVTWLERLTSGPALYVFLKINSGMNRLGFSPDKVETVLQRLQTLPSVKNICLMTHFASADADEENVALQWTRFDMLHQTYPDLPICAANSAAIMRHPHTHGQWVRPGIVLYGSSPFTDVTAQTLGLRPVMHLSSQLIAIQDIAPGQAIGYGATFIADKAMQVGIVACGYADGYPRHAPTGTPVIVQGKRCALLGRVSMDMLCVDVSHVPSAVVGSPVELWGAQLSIDEVAACAGTISYELLCALTPRVRVEYVYLNDTIDNFIANQCGSSGQMQQKEQSVIDCKRGV